MHGTSDTDLALVVNGTSYPDGSYESMWVANQPNHLAEPYANASEPAYFTFTLSDQAGITQYDNISVSLTAWDVDEPSPTEIWLGNADPTDLGAGVKTLLGPLTGGKRYRVDYDLRPYPGSDRGTPDGGRGYSLRHRRDG